MKNISFILLLGSLVAMSCNKDSETNPSTYVNNVNDTLTLEEKKGLLFMRQEEKLAGDVYRHYFVTWKFDVFNNISQSEDRHTSSVLSLLQKYGVADPIAGFSEGFYLDSNLQNLYGQLVSDGEKSLLDALIIGATIEDLDLRDLSLEVEKTKKADILQVYSNLTKGSRNHLRTFYSELLSRGYTYKPQYISEAEFKEIINSPKEHGKM